MSTHEREGLYSIGELSKQVKISSDTLRYYDEIGLLKPAFASEETGYRYYSDEQAATLARILELKQYGFSLNQIKDILTNGEAPSAAVYQNRYTELLREQRRLQEAINKISGKIIQKQEVSFMGKRILLVDDATFMRMMWRDMLSREGYSIAGEASDGAEAVQLYKETAPDLILLDIVMPSMDGLYALQQIKAFDPQANAVMCSAMGQAYIVTESLMAGAQGFVEKPFQPDTLLAAVRNAFSRVREYDRAFLERIHDQLADQKHHNLSQSEIDEMIDLASDGITDNARTEAFIRKITFGIIPTWKQGE